ncbi:mRNA decay activator protein ZFP36L2-like [Paramormyrops kingsleyae]|uniref:mRNA decay activator protein ZFP36 n=1 Tax=Paramormyrops kingsleyae TaxID=1676925 RepID=A0A3B3SCR1_9TELE|nr:mRNA decay activator protein ZFP36L2-like [Paramormyrops kingsleyae]
MSATILPMLRDIDFLLTQEKRLNVAKMPLGLADRKAVGVPLSGSSCTNRCYSRSQSSSGSFAGCPGFSFAEEPLAVMNKENAFLLQEVLQQRAGAQANSARYKTELCRPFEENGVCKYGDKCQFAHGYGELRNLSRHPKYKTEPCRTFHTIGYCPYGPRCHFIHNADERRLPSQGETAAPRERCAFGPGEAGERDRPALYHSVSFAGFSGRGSPVSRMPPPPSSCPFSLYEDGLPPGLSFPGRSLEALLAPLRSGYNDPSSDCFFGTQLSPPSPPYPSRRRRSPSPVFERAHSPSDSISDRDSYTSGSDSPSPEAGKRLPIFSRLSISDD